MSNAEKLIIFDTTLRDGEQSPGASMTLTAKVQIAKMLERMGVDVIEAGFATASAGDFAAIQAVARDIRESIVCSLARTQDHDIDQAFAAIRSAPRKRIHVFIATSAIHMQYKLKLSPEQVLEYAVRAVKRARNYVDDVEFSCEDAGRSNSDFLCRIVERVIAAGATTINLPDTVGYTIPAEFAALVGGVITRTPNADRATFSVHCHNDLGLAVANSLAALQVGARQIECTINGLGERAGNAALEEIVMTLKTRSDQLPYAVNIDTAQIVPASRLVAQVTGFPVQPNKAIVGANAFAHEAGIHQDGVIKHRQTYEIMQAADVGWNTNRLVLGKHSGRHALRQRLKALGYDLSTEALDQCFVRFKSLADQKHEVYDEDLHSLMQVSTAVTDQRFQLRTLNVECGSDHQAVARLMLDDHQQAHTVVGRGSGPVAAVFAAIEIIAQSNSTLHLYSVNAITRGIDAQGEVTVRLLRGDRLVNGTGADPDIIVASAKAYIHALNLLYAPQQRQHPQGDSV